MNSVNAVKQLLLQSGAGWVLWFLAGLSVITLAICVERWFFYLARHCDVQVLARSVGDQLAARDFAAAIETLAKSRSVAAAIAAAGLQFAERGPASAERAMQSAVALERGRLERGLAYLGTLGNNAPFIGLFGTVIGIIGAFEELGRAAPARGAAELASQAVMSSIAEALVATALGILVALPAIAAYNYFQRRIAALLLTTDVLSNLVLAHLADRTARATGTDGMAG